MNSTKSTVLVVDDEKDIRDICHGIIMRSFECSVLAKESIESARHAIESEHIDLAILDIHLQDGIGFDHTVTPRSTPRRKNHYDISLQSLQ